MLFWGIFAALVAGLAIKYGLDRLNGRDGAKTLSWTEFAIGAVICGAVVVPATVWAGSKVAVSNTVGGYQEWWNGVETSADKHVRSCSRNSGCRRTYSCDPHEVLHYRSESYQSGTDSQGRPTYSTRQVPYYVTEYHSCPYTTEEWTFTVENSLGDKETIADGVLPENPDEYRYRPQESSMPGIPQSLRESAGTPARWQASASRLAENRPLPVTVRRDYTNYILASQNQLVEDSGSLVKAFLAQKVLPKPATTADAEHQADKVYFAGAPIDDPEHWQDTVMAFNARLGTERQGDLHVVVVNTPGITDPTEYADALMAYWQGPELAKQGIAKNALVVILGTRDGKTVAWTRARTGMPAEDNQELLERIQGQLTERELDPVTLIGRPGARLSGDEVVFEPSDGVLEGLVFSDEFGFTRVEMTDPDNGYVLLRDEIKPTGGQATVIVVVATLLSLGVWGLFIWLDNTVLSGLTGRLRRS